MRGATYPFSPLSIIRSISTHAPLAGRDRTSLHRRACPRYFNPRAPCGARPRSLARMIIFSYFNPRAPCGARLGSLFVELAPVCEFQPTRPLRGATPVSQVNMNHMDISTHAPLAGRDGLKHGRRICYHHFNPRAPCGARQQRSNDRSRRSLFQPTRPLRGATRVSR